MGTRMNRMMWAATGLAPFAAESRDDDFAMKLWESPVLMKSTNFSATSCLSTTCDTPENNKNVITQCLTSPALAIFVCRTNVAVLSDYCGDVANNTKPPARRAFERDGCSGRAVGKAIPNPQWGIRSALADHDRACACCFFWLTTAAAEPPLVRKV